jgi:hypothetical protein
MAVHLINLSVFWFGMYFWLYQHDKSAGTIPFSQKPDFNYLYQVKQDWQQQPFTDLILRDDFCPESHPFEVFYSLWPG